MIDSNGQDRLETPRRVGVLGAGGQLGRCLVRQIEGAPDLALAFALTRKEIDLSRAESLSADIAALLDAAESELPEVVINAAAHTKVDLCESEPALAYQTNALAPAEWSQQLARREIRFIHVSTDYVFAGDGVRPYREGDPTDPRTVYGASKRAGEVAVLGSDPDALVVRTSWVFGPGRNFVVAILEQAVKRRVGEVEGPLEVVDDQHGSPTFVDDLAFALLAIARQEREEWGGGLLHLCNRGETTWFGFAREILDQAGFEEIAIAPVPSSRFETAAKRPAYSILDCSWAEGKGIVMPPWQDALSRYLAGPDRPEMLPPSSPAPSPATPPTSVRQEVSR
ncbi:MAG: dTDP-4-dehydrorhamnose reductase [bacterium]|nr:dTDP-4-dehydrorhamnose reductase [Deltaproteobacteria bacterium]MCP4907074.1 dTDP-4-dehydrorhamnose reductase [bacterium]